MGGAFGEAGLGEPRRLAGTSAGHPLEHMFPRYVPDATPPAQAPATMPCAAFWWVKSVTGINAGLAGRGCVRYIPREHMFKRVTC